MVYCANGDSNQASEAAEESATLRPLEGAMVISGVPTVSDATQRPNARFRARRGRRMLRRDRIRTLVFLDGCWALGEPRHIM